MADVWIHNPMRHVQVAACETSIISLRSDGTLWALGTNKYGEFGVAPATLASVSEWTQLDMDRVDALYKIGTGVYVIRKDGTCWYSGYAKSSKLTMIPNSSAAVNTWTQAPLRGLKHIFVKRDASYWVAATGSDETLFQRGYSSGEDFGGMKQLTEHLNVIESGQWRYASGTTSTYAAWWVLKDGTFIFNANDSSTFNGSGPFVKSGRTSNASCISTLNNVKHFEIANSAYDSGSSNYNWHFYGCYKILYTTGRVGVRCIKYNTDYNSNANYAFGYTDTNTHTYALLSITDVKQIYSQGDSLSYNTYFLKNDGTVWVCGANGSGCLGINSTGTQSGIVQSQIDKVEYITGNKDSNVYTLFVKKDGALFML